MPKKYIAMRDRFKGEGMSDKAAKKKAAMIYNSQRKTGQKPVGSHKEDIDHIAAEIAEEFISDR